MHKVTQTFCGLKSSVGILIQCHIFKCTHKNPNTVIILPGVPCKQLSESNVNSSYVQGLAYTGLSAGLGLYTMYIYAVKVCLHNM